MEQSLCLRRGSNLRSDHLAAMLSSRDELPLGRRIFVCGTPRSSPKTPFCGFHKKRLPLSQETSSCSSHHRQQQVVVSQHECVDVLCRGRAGTWDPDGKSANSIIHKGLPFPFFLCYKAEPVPSPLSPLSTVKLSALHQFATFLTGQRWISTFGRKCRCVSQMFTAPPPSTAAAGVVRVE